MSFLKRGHTIVMFTRLESHDKFKRELLPERLAERVRLGEHVARRQGNGQRMQNSGTLDF